jgi:hypothetical protein
MSAKGERKSCLYGNNKHIREALQRMWRAKRCYKISKKLMLGTRVDLCSEVRGSNSMVSRVQENCLRNYKANRSKFMSKKEEST